MAALADPVASRGYPPSAGTAALRRAATGWMARRFGVEVDERAVAACVGTKELVAGLPSWLRLRWPERDVVLHPAVAYPSYAMGATLAGAQAVRLPVRSDGTSDLEAVPDQLWERALVLWVNSPANPTGRLDDLDRVVAAARERGVLVASDECYAEFVWTGKPATALGKGTTGVLAVHSLSKRSNMAGLRAGFYAGDEDLVAYLSELRKHAGFMVPGPVQAAMVVALEDDQHVELQRALRRAARVPCRAAGVPRLPLLTSRRRVLRLGDQGPRASGPSAQRMGPRRGAGALGGDPRQPG